MQSFLQEHGGMGSGMGEHTTSFIAFSYSILSTTNEQLFRYISMFCLFCGTMTEVSVAGEKEDCVRMIRRGKKNWTL